MTTGVSEPGDCYAAQIPSLNNGRGWEARDTVYLPLILKSPREESPRITLTDITIHHLKILGCSDVMGPWGFSLGKGIVLRVWEEGSKELFVD